MKRLIYIGIMVLVLSVATACTNNGNDEIYDPIDSNLDNEVETNEENNATENQDDNKTSNDDDQTVMQEKMDKLNFQEFELDVDYSDDTEYEAEIDKSATGIIEAELEDEGNNIELKGLQAFDEIYPLIEKLDFTKDSSEADIINKVITAFDISQDYTKIEVQIVFNDGTKIKHEVAK